jgi:CMP-N-acetylneuraminic acid synthetase
MKTAAIIPIAESFAKKDFCGRPLYEWTEEVAKESQLFDNIILEDREGEVNDLLVINSQERPEIELWCVLLITAPLRTVKDIQQAHKKAQAKKHDSVVSVYHDPIYGWVKDAVGMSHGKQPIALYHYQRTQVKQSRENWYLENSAVYFVKLHIIKLFGVKTGGSVGLYEMPRERSFEVDTPIGWKLCEFLMKERINDKSK